jgi:predicted RNA methylase
MRKVEDWVSDIFKQSEIDGTLLKLPGQLDRDKYVKVNKVIEGLGGKWNRKLGGHVFPFDPKELITTTAEVGAYVDRKQELQFFETPVALAERMAELANLSEGDVVLEPSAGHGRIVSALADYDVNIIAVEIDKTNVHILDELSVPNTEVVQGDFLGYASGTNMHFNAVVMNPPFSNHQDIDHIRAAAGLLMVSGRLVAICSESPFFRQDKKSVEFREWISKMGFTVEKLPENTFKESGTGVNVRLIYGTIA